MKFLSLLFLTAVVLTLNANAEDLPKLINEDYKAYSDSLEHNITSFTYLDDDGSYKTYLLSSQESDNNNPIFQIGSVSKLFTAHALCNMVINGDLKLTTKVKEVLPFVTFKDERIANITLEQLANHSSGLPRLPVNIFVGMTDSLQPYQNYTKSMLYNFLANYELVRAPGKSYEYSNLGFGLLGNILDTYLAKNKNTTLEKYIQKEIFDKAGMKDTGFELTVEQKEREVQPYIENSPTPAWEFDVIKWAGAYYSTTQDLAKYLNQFVTKTPVFDQKVLELSRTITFEPNPNMRMSLGWHITPLGSSTVYWHNGNTYGNSAFIGFTSSGKFVAVLSNSNRILDSFAVDVLNSMK
ncbi:MAG: serine hydrolase domain-containing protein [Candidatus Kapaibacterium sp.]